MITCTFENGLQNSLRHVTVDCLVLRDGQILLAKRADGMLEANKWCLPGGFAERNETTAETARREVLEETGWSISNLTLLSINDSPTRPGEDRQNIDFIYFTDAQKQVAKRDLENTSIQWFSLDALPPAEKIAFDHADYIELYRRYRSENITLPVVGTR